MPLALRGGGGAIAALAKALVFVTGVAVVATAVATQMDAADVRRTLAALVGLICAAALFFSRRYERSLFVVFVYVGVLDGYLKLSTGVDNITLLRDLLFYAIVAGATLRLIVSTHELRVPPLTGFVVAWTTVVLVQVFNPGSGLGHAVAATRQHLEFVPLFFFGYAVLTTQQRIRWLMIGAVVIGAANGVANLVQSQLSPEQFAAWGPGYQELLITGAAGGAKRTFADPLTGEQLVRTFGLGGDFGFGGIVCAFALGPAIALLMQFRHTRAPLLLVAPGLVLAVVGIVTSALRTAAVGGVIVVIAFAILAVTSRRALASIIVVSVLAMGAFFGIRAFVTSGQTAGLSRFSTIAPSQLVGTAISSRGGSLESIPQFASEYPLGAGLGTVGPAAAETGSSVKTGANSENEFSFLLAEVGIPGMLILLAFLLTLLGSSLRVVHGAIDPSERVLLAGLLSPLFFLGVSWFTGTSTTSAYTAGYLWLIGGVIAGRIERLRVQSDRWRRRAQAT